MTNINYNDIILLSGIQVGSSFERDLNAIRSIPLNNLDKILDFVFKAYIKDVPLNEEDLKLFSESVDMHPVSLQRSMNFLFFLFKNATKNKEKIEDFENDLIKLNLSEFKDQLVERYISYQNELRRIENEKLYTFVPQLYTTEWKIIRNLSVSTGKFPGDISAIINISYLDMSRKTQVLEFETNVANLKSIIANLNRCLKEAEKCQEALKTK